MEGSPKEEGQVSLLQNTGFDLIARFQSGGAVYRHFKVDCTADDYCAVEEIAYDKAWLGCEVLILPELSEEDPLRALVFRGAKENKCPDLKVDGRFVEIKTPTKSLSDTKISTNIKRGYEQANHVVINLIEHFSSGKLYKIAKGRFKTHETLEIVEFKMAGKYHIFESRKVLKKLK
jgi:hypothetical protein